jgi:hypothetical protein
MCRETSKWKRVKQISLIERTRRIVSAVAGLALCLALLACSGPMPGFIQTAVAAGLTPTPTHVPFAAAPAPHFTILVTYTMSYNDVVIDTAYYSKTTSLLTGNLTLTPAPNDGLTGTGQITFSKSFTTNSSRCATTWQVGPLTWTVALDGDYYQHPDGSLDIFFVAEPGDGPTFPVDYTCTGIGTETPLFIPADGTGGLLVHGKLDFQKILPVTEIYHSGNSTVQYHFELAPENH